MWSFDMGALTGYHFSSENLPVSRVDPRRFSTVVVDEI